MQSNSNRPNCREMSASRQIFARLRNRASAQPVARTFARPFSRSRLQAAKPAVQSSYPLPDLPPEIATTKFPLSFYAKAFAIGLVLGSLLEALMSTTGFYDSLREAEGRKAAREMAELSKIADEMKKEEVVAGKAEK